MSSVLGRVLMMTTPSLLSHQRRTVPQPCSEASQVMTAMWAEPVSPARKAALSELGTNGHWGLPAYFSELLKDVSDEDGSV